MVGNTASYTIVTPCKNEEWNLPNLIRSVLAQTIRPILWVIVDDGSTDKSGEILDKLEKEYDWVKLIHLEDTKEYLGTHISHVYNAGFKYIIDYSKKSNLEWEYIGILDSDAIAEPRYFEKLIQKLEEDPKLGIASGLTCEITENITHVLEEKNTKMDITSSEFWNTYPFSLKEEILRTDLPMGSARLYKKRCFEETGGMFESISSPDTISTIKAKMMGWETALFKEIKLIERSSLSAQGKWCGYKERGKSGYEFNLPFYVLFLKSLKYSTKKPYYSGIAYLSGYFESFFSSKQQIKDKEIIKYYQSVHLTETKKYNKEILKNIFFKK
jgi:glycosyltransferase involved in cell wall biosynthesis